MPRVADQSGHVGESVSSQRSLSTVAQKSNQEQPGQEAGLGPSSSPHDKEFDDAVTTEISDVLASAFNEDRATDPGDVYVTDTQLTAHVDPASDDALSPGFLLKDRFEIVDLVHSGGMSLVYKAIDHSRRAAGRDEKHVAIKTMRSSIASDEESRLTLEREAAQAQRLSHANIIDIFDVDEHEGRSFLVMEWMEGESVNAMLRRTRGERLESSLAWSVIAGAAAGVQHAHQSNVVHADINPSNIFITERLQIKVLDFGVARDTSSLEPIDDDRFAWVTQPYASPEVLSGLPPVVEDDVFSLACVAYRLLAGKHPFGGRLSLVAKHQGRSVEPIPWLAADEWRILEKALAYERSDRSESVAELLACSERAAGADKHEGTLGGRLVTRLRTPLAAVAAIVIVAGGFWLLQPGSDDQAVPQVEPASPEEAVIDEPVEAPEIPAAEALVTAATEALNAENPGEAYAALAAATETDPENPAIAIVDQLLASKGNAELAAARLAAATGSFDDAEQLLSRAQQYSHIDPAQIRSLRDRIAERRQSDQLLDRLAVADGHLTAGRLLLPDGDNAHTLLLDLHGQHGDDARVLASMERLGERLLSRAAFAAAAMRVTEASDLLDAVDALGVLPSEVEAARLSLATVAEAAEADVAAGTDEGNVAAEADEADGSAETEDVSGPSVVDNPADDAAAADNPPSLQASDEQVDEVSASGDEQASQSSQGQPDEVLLVAAARTSAVPEEPLPETAEPETRAEPENLAEPDTRRLSLRELGITDYVAPTYPRRAERRRVSGMVEVEFVINADGSTGSIEVLQSRPGDLFVESATDAVRLWRFETREEAMPAQITLRFEQGQ